MKDVILYLWKSVEFRRKVIAMVVIILIAEGVAIQVLPFVNREITSLIEQSAKGSIVPSDALVLPTLAAIIAILAYMSLTRAMYYIANLLRVDVDKYIHAIGIEKLLYHDLAYLTDKSSGGLLNKIKRAAGRISGLFTSSLQALFRNVTKAVVALIIITAIYWPVTVIIFAMVTIYIGIYWIRYKVNLPNVKEEDRIYDKDMARIWEVVPQAKLTKMFANEKYELDRLNNLFDKVKENTNRQEKLWTFAVIPEMLFVQTVQILTQIWVGALAIQGVITLPNFVLLFALINSAVDPLYIVNWFIWELQDTTERSREFVKIMKSSPTLLDVKTPQIIENAFGDIVFSNVTFRYKKGKKDILNDLSMVFPGGKVSALVGKSGVGKTTITKLLCRLYDPVKGGITIGGTSIDEVRQQELRTHVGIVLQESFVFSGTVTENLRYARVDATKKEMIASLEKAHAWDFVKEFPKGLETEIGERGVKLSGGQRQRIAIARTILKDAPVLILDEATNALDSESEHHVQEALKDFMVGRTVIIIAHRLSTIQHADCIYVLDENGIAEQGTHEKLLEKGGIYRMLYDIQAGGFYESVKIMKEYDLE